MGFEPHVNATLEDASIQLLSEMVEEVHAGSQVESAVLWSNLRKMAGLLGSRRVFWSSHEASGGTRRHEAGRRHTAGRLAGSLSESTRADDPSLHDPLDNY